ncbi:hypothetical protein HO173_004250 [Letharia columbiana]|uniref:Rhodopsin domain-containing protein n=1 Tax=Letharia columbiana TaxID=112416 RepID=A0A8H6FZ47_9LECA|nr:uncharacterized protein HO173_004250 [Letharia columbiana]KAF6237360.1 hypothetical protein HO173_004250 [Letharia columbiana]
MSLSDSFSVPKASSSTHSAEQAHIRGTVVFTWSLMLIIVSLRFVARRLSKVGLWYDDWLIIPATLSATTCFASAIWMTQHGLGQNVYILSPNQLDTFLKGMFISEIGWPISICMVKCSILAFYWRLFSSYGRSFRISVWAFLALMVNWGIVVVIATVFQCSPRHRPWSEGRCVNNTYWFFVGSSIPHIITDIALISLPMPLIWKLQMRRSQKAILSFIFGLGGFVTIVAIVRLVYLIKADAEPADVTINLSNILIWTGVEVNMSVVCACLPSLRPIVAFISDKFKQLCKRKSTHTKGLKLLMGTLRPSDTATVLPLSSKKSWDDGHHPILDSSFVVEMEAIAPHFEAKAPGRWVSEVEAVEPAVAMGTEKTVAGMGETSV